MGGCRHKRGRFKRRTEQCFVPFCSSSSRHTPTVSFHSFPSDSVLRARWLAKIHSSTSDFSPKKDARVCGRHFLRGDFAAGQTKLHKGAVPVRFRWNEYTAPKPSSVHSAPAVADHNYCWTPSVAVGAEELVAENDALHHTIRKLEVQRQLDRLRHQNRKQFSVQRLAGAPDEDVRFYTRFSSFNHFEAFWRLVEPDVDNKMEWRAKTTLLPVDELLLFLMFLSVGLPPGDLAERFGVHRTAACRIIETWAHFLYAVLGSSRLCGPQEVVGAPGELSAFPDTRAVLSYVSVSCRTPSPCLETTEFPEVSRFKALIGMAPHGAVTFVSRLYAASTSDRRIFKHSGVARLLGPDVTVMVDEEILADAPCKVYRPALFLKTPAEKRSHLKLCVARSLRSVKENRLFSGAVPLPVWLSINELFSVACFLVNYQQGLLGKS